MTMISDETNTTKTTTTTTTTTIQNTTTTSTTIIGKLLLRNRPQQQPQNEPEQRTTTLQKCLFPRNTPIATTMAPCRCRCSWIMSVVPDVGCCRPPDSRLRTQPPRVRPRKSINTDHPKKLLWWWWWWRVVWWSPWWWWWWWSWTAVVVVEAKPRWPTKWWVAEVWNPSLYYRDRYSNRPTATATTTTAAITILKTTGMAHATPPATTTTADHGLEERSECLASCGSFSTTTERTTQISAQTRMPTVVKCRGGDGSRSEGGNSNLSSDEEEEEEEEEEDDDEEDDDDDHDTRVNYIGDKDDDPKKNNHSLLSNGPANEDKFSLSLSNNPTATTTKRRKGRLLLDLFHYHNVLKASVVEGEDEVLHLLFHSLPAEDETTTTTTTKKENHRGGAFVPLPAPLSPLPPLDDDKAMAQRHGLFLGGWGRQFVQWLVPSGSSSSNTATLTREDERNEPGQPKNAQQRQAPTDLGRLWWNQAWMDPIPQQDEPDAVVSSSSSSLLLSDPQQPRALLIRSADVPLRPIENDDDEELDGEEEEKEEGNDDDDQASNDIFIVLEEEEDEEEEEEDVRAEPKPSKDRPSIKDEEATKAKAKASTTSSRASSENKPKKKKRKKKKSSISSSSSARKNNTLQETLPSSRSSADPSHVTTDVVNASTTTPAAALINQTMEEKEELEEEDIWITAEVEDPTPFTSSGAWIWIDAMLTPAYVKRYWKPSRSLRPLRKTVAHWTGMHGVLSGKRNPRQLPKRVVAENVPSLASNKKEPKDDSSSSSSSTQTEPHDVETSSQQKQQQQEDEAKDEGSSFLQRKLRAIDQAKENVTRVEEEEDAELQKPQRLNRFAFWKWGRPPTKQNNGEDTDDDDTQESKNGNALSLTVQVAGANEARGPNGDGSSASGTLSVTSKAQLDEQQQQFTRQQKQQQHQDQRQKHQQAQEKAKRQRRRHLDEQQLKQERLKEIDRLMEQKSRQMASLATEKDLILNMMNPLWNYSFPNFEGLHASRRQAEEREAPSDKSSNSNEDVYESIVPTREFNFPTDDLVEEYITALVQSERLIKMNHTDLWRNVDSSECDKDDDDDDLDDDEWLTAEELERRRVRARTSQAAQQQQQQQQQHRNGDHAGSRWLRIQGVGEKIGQAIEDMVYKAICFQVMGGLARGVAGGLHGITVMGHADIGIQAEQGPVLPPTVAAGPYSNIDSYARKAFENAISKQQTASSYNNNNNNNNNKNSKSKKRKPPTLTAADSVQRYAVIETLLSQCQVAMPLLKMFPLVWQRALIGNLVTVITAVLGDFLQGLEFQVLGYRLELALKPITEQDVMRRLEQQASQRHFRQSPYYYNRQHPKDGYSHKSPPSFQSTGGDRGGPPYWHGHYEFDDWLDEEDPARSHQAFEAAVQATAADLAENLKFLDKWHERVFMGGDAIRMQVATLIARVVLSLVDDILSDARIDLWSSLSYANSDAHKKNMMGMMMMMGGGPRLKAGLYYRHGTVNSKHFRQAQQQKSPLSP